MGVTVITMRVTLLAFMFVGSGAAIVTCRRWSKRVRMMMMQPKLTASSVLLPDGCTLPHELVGEADAPLRVVYGHGIGAKSHQDDTLFEVIRASVAGAAVRAVAYTARGHGASTGCQESPPDAFLWSALAGDMRAVAEAHDMRRFVAAGSSMGAATALYAALQAPERVEALVLARLPTAWSARVARRTELRKKAEGLRATGEGVLARFYEGNAPSDLPAQEKASYAPLAGIPVLILCHGEDDVHPVETGLALSRLLPSHASSRIVIVRDLADAKAKWPSIIADWLRSLPTS